MGFVTTFADFRSMSIKTVVVQVTQTRVSIFALVALQPIVVFYKMLAVCAGIHIKSAAFLAKPGAKVFIQIALILKAFITLCTEQFDIRMPVEAVFFQRPTRAKHFVTTFALPASVIFHQVETVCITVAEDGTAVSLVFFTMFTSPVTKMIIQIPFILKSLVAVSANMRFTVMLETAVFFHVTYKGTNFVTMVAFYPRMLCH
jgi:hypothetical protein